MGTRFRLLVQDLRDFDKCWFTLTFIAIESVTQDGGWDVDKDSCEKDFIFDILVDWTNGDQSLTRRLTIHKLCLHYRV